MVSTDAPPVDRRGRVPRPPKSYAFYRDFIRDAVENDAPPSPQLIAHNKRLAAWETYLGIAEVSSFPVRFQAAITDVCNARCTFCPYAPENHTGRTVQLADIERADWLKFVERFDPNSALGEPLVHPEIGAILETVRRQAPYIKIGMTTNASLMTPRVITAITGHVSSLVVSLNAARKETYEEVMRPLRWDRTLANLRALSAEKQRRDTRLPVVQGSIVVHRHVLDELPELPAVLRSVGIDQLRVLVMSVPKPVESRRLFTTADLIHHEPDRANRAFAALREQAARHGVRLVNQPPVLATR